MFRQYLVGAKLDCRITRLLHKVHHNKNRQIFYVSFDIYEKTAVLQYNLENKVMDLRAIYVPDKYTGKGIARLLTETAITYAIKNNYFLFLTCTYTQKYYLCYKNSALEELIIGPQHILDANVSIDVRCFQAEPDPQDFFPQERKNN
ncbi:hypothetical protein QAD02_010262 [Eretmocerus hayati]|uniref:Uncharacterized protein n=1 Tax=Eretmocerus hayati TaxID=131215 RepID=A0ACC2NE34_9HYME|nr:hypothetical protein QAD02_010262 [Eretmocerus hayati]